MVVGGGSILSPSILPICCSGCADLVIAAGKGCDCHYDVAKENHSFSCEHRYQVPQFLLLCHIRLSNFHLCYHSVSSLSSTKLLHHLWTADRQHDHSAGQGQHIHDVRLSQTA
jgi:hypothetical protein